TGCVTTSSGATSTPPVAAAIRTSRPATARWSTPSTSRLARSTPNTRKRLVESSKSYGSGKRSSDIGERVEGLEGVAPVGEIARETVARKDALARERRAAVRVAVADEDQRVLVRQGSPFAAVAAD